MGVMPFLAACHACVLMLYYIVTIVCYVCSFEWQNKVLSLLYYTWFAYLCFLRLDIWSVSVGACAEATIPMLNCISRLLNEMPVDQSADSHFPKTSTFDTPDDTPKLCTVHPLATAQKLLNASRHHSTLGNLIKFIDSKCRHGPLPGVRITGSIV